MLHSIYALLAVAASLVFVASSPARAADPRRPNILFIVGDDMGYADVGFHGCKEIPTPNLDALAASGVRFTNGYVTGPYCSPTRAGLMTGRYQQRFGHDFNPDGSGQGLPLTERTIADRFRAAGYRTALIGKWHLGASDAMQPLARGFDEFYGFLGGQHSYFDKKGVVRGKQPVESLDYTTDAFAREAVSFIEKNKEQPWLLLLTFNAVHTPMDATEKYLDRFKHISDQRRRTYCAMMSAMDDGIGQVIGKLKSTGQLNDTLVAFISDNGGPTMVSTTVNGSNNAPLRGSKRTTLEGGIRVPFVLSWPGKIQAAVYEQPVVQLDLLPTALAAANIPAQAEWKLDGVNLLPFVNSKEEAAPHGPLYWRMGKQMAIRNGNWKLVAYDTNADTDSGGKQPLSSLKLYDLSKDIHEDHDLSAQNPEVAAELKVAMGSLERKKYRSRMGRRSY